jgi:hypothetical protein
MWQLVVGLGILALAVYLFLWALRTARDAEGSLIKVLGILASAVLLFVALGVLTPAGLRWFVQRNRGELQALLIDVGVPQNAAAVVGSSESSGSFLPNLGGSPPDNNAKTEEGRQADPEQDKPEAQVTTVPSPNITKVWVENPLQAWAENFVIEGKGMMRTGSLYDVPRDVTLSVTSVKGTFFNNRDTERYEVVARVASHPEWGSETLEINGHVAGAWEARNTQGVPISVKGRGSWPAGSYREVTPTPTVTPTPSPTTSATVITMAPTGTPVPTMQATVSPATEIRLVVKVNSGRVRESASLGSRIVGTVSRGQELTASQKQGEWYHIPQGWVHEDLVSVK